MPFNNGQTSFYPGTLDTFYKQVNAINDPTTGNMIGDIIASRLKNKMSDALINLEKDISGAPTAAGGDIRISAVTRALLDVHPGIPYTVFLPGSVADFIGRGNIGYTEQPSIQLVSVRPYYAPYDATTKAKVTAMWLALSADQFIKLPQQFMVWFTGGQEAQVSIQFNPSATVTGSAAYTTGYNAATYGVGSFIASLILISYHY